jgi:glycosyltransferase involved in cell wall biosynthesis
VVSFYQRSHLLIVSSLHEGAPVAALEAAACGLPTVGTAVGCVSDFDPGMAIAVRPGDHEALAAAAASLLDDEERRRRIASAARTWVLAHDAGWWTGEIDRIYDAVRFAT